jgi:polar amino acid transport system permease protein
MFQQFTWGHVTFLLLAMQWTVALSAIALLGGILGGIVLAWMRISSVSWLSGIAQAYVYVVQGTPLLVQLFLAYFGAAFAGIDVPPLVAAAIALTLYASAFFGEMWRGALTSVPTGQRDAGRALGLRETPILWLVIIPQAIRPAIPPTVGFVVHLVKNTALASVIGFRELTRAGQLVANATFQPLPVFLTVALGYFLLCYPLSLLARYLEAKMQIGAANYNKGGLQ